MLMVGLGFAAFCGIAVGCFVVVNSRDSEYEPILAARHGANRLKSKRTKAPPGCTIDVILVRHCERGSLRQHCTRYGFERAEHFATLFGDDDQARWPAPQALLAREPERPKLVYRSIEMLEPLGKKFDLPVQSEGNSIGNKKSMVKDMFSDFRSGEYCGGTIVVSWKHENIPKLARQLGCGPDNGCPERWMTYDYDSTWNIRYEYNYEEFSSHKSGKIPSKPDWTITGSVQKQGFDAIVWERQKGKEGTAGKGVQEVQDENGAAALPPTP